MPAAESIATLVDRYPAGVKRLIQATRRWVKAALPGVSERADTSARLIAYSDGPGYVGAVCTIILSKNGVKLGLVGGAALADPHGLLAGNGKVHRHVALKSPDDLDMPGLRLVLLDARAACDDRLRRTRAPGRAKTK